MPTRLSLSELESRAMPAVTLIGTQAVTGTEGAATPNQTLATFGFTLGNTSDYSAEINWGDGVISRGNMVAATPYNPSQVDVKASHIYAHFGSYSPVVTLKGKGETGTGTRASAHSSA